MLDPGFLLVQALNGLASASALFLAAVGLTLVFGVTRIVNFAHGSLYMLGAYIAWSASERLLGMGLGAVGFWAAVLGTAVAVGLLGIVLEVVLFRRIYAAPELFQLLATFGVVLIVQDAVLLVWGPEDLLGPRAPGLTGFVPIAGRRFPTYELMLVAAGPIVLGLLLLLFHRTRFGILVRAATQDREMVAALGVDQRRLFTSVLFLGAFLAGLAGALQLPREAANSLMDVSIIVEAFVVTVIGGMGSLGGAFLAAVIVGELQAFGIVVLPRVTLVLVFLVMAVVLVVRPYGLLGRAEPVGAGRATSAPALVLPSAGVWTAWAVGITALYALPLVADAYALTVATEIAIIGLFAFSLHFILSIGGLVSFGHAAWFGLGAYAAALLVRHLGAGMAPALLAAPVAGALGALVFGRLCVRLSGIYLAMLTLAVAQILHGAAVQWVELTGGDNGLLGIWPAPWVASRTSYYWLALTACLLGIGLLHRIIHAPFGYALRAVRDRRLRAEAIGIAAERQQGLAFGLAGAAAGLAGGLHAFHKGSVGPEVLSIATSLDALVMVLLGGVETVMGPLVGAAALTLLQDFLMPLTDHWRGLMGLVIILVVLLLPGGLLGTAIRWPGRRSAAPGRVAAERPS